MPDVAPIGYAPDPAPTPRQAPAKVVSVTLTFDSGATIVYPCDKPTRLTRPPSRVDLIGGKSYIDERQ